VPVLNEHDWLLDFAFAAILLSFPRTLRRIITSKGSTFYTDPSKTQEPGVPTSPSPVISLEQREILDNALRVDQSGEIAANWIYRGRVTVLDCDPRLGLLIQLSHLETAIQSLSIDLTWQRKCGTRRNDLRKSWIHYSHR
jgi:demethoxyubiquinone hydroxylase (CLK1/Coq7/Cat5 family)